jgi:hypothetical protein
LTTLAALLWTAGPAAAQQEGERSFYASITGHAGSQTQGADSWCEYGVDLGRCVAATSDAPPPDRLRLVRDEGVRITFEHEGIPAGVQVSWGPGPLTDVPPANPTVAPAAGTGDTQLNVNARWVDGDLEQTYSWVFQVTVVEQCDNPPSAPPGEQVSGYDSDHDGVCDAWLIPPTQFLRTEEPHVDAEIGVGDGPVHGADTTTTAALTTSTTATTIPVEVKAVSIERPAPTTVPHIALQHSSARASHRSTAAYLLAGVLFTAALLSLMVRRLVRS